MKIRVSIITVSYNSEKTIEETIKSVLNQDYNDIEYIIIDGCSTDHTLDIVNQYRNRISKVISEPDKGISDAFNKGIGYSTGEIIGIINSDDILCEGAINHLVSSYSKDIGVYRGDMVIWNDKTNTELLTKPTMSFPLSKSIKNVCHPSTFISRSTYLKYGNYDLNLKYMMDCDILYRYYKHDVVFKYINKPLAKFRLGGATSDNLVKKLPEFSYLLTKNGGSKFIVLSRTVQLILYDNIKKMIFFLFGSDFSRKIKYKL